MSKISNTRLVKIDETDGKILYELDINGRASYKQIADKLGMYSNTVRRRIKRLEKTNILRGYTIGVDIYSVGYFTYNIFIQFRVMSPEKYEQFCQFLIESEFVSFALSLLGRYSVMITVKARDMLHREEFLRQLEERFGDNFMERRPCSRIESYYYPKKYLLPKVPEQVPVFASESKHESRKLSENDLAILNELKSDCHRSALAIAQKLNLSATTVSDRIKKLIKTKIIKRFKTKIAILPLGYVWYLVLLSLKKYDSKTIEKLKTFTKSHPNITFMNISRGNWHIIMDIHCRTARECNNIMTEIRTIMSELLAGDQVEAVLDVIKNDYKFS